MDKSSKHLKDVEEEIKEIEQGFCMRLCCSAKNKKVKSKNIDKTQRDDEGDSAFSVEHDSIYTNNQLDNLDANLQKLQYFNRLIDREFENQIETLVCHSLLPSSSIFFGISESSSSSSRS